MKNQDLRKGIIPRTLQNNDKNGYVKKEYETTDLVYLDSYEDQAREDITDEERRVSATDHAKIHNVYMSDCKTKQGKSSCWWGLSSLFNMTSVSCVLHDGNFNWYWCDDCTLGLRPALRYNLPSNISARSAYNTENEEKNETESDELQIELIGENHCLQLGERPKTKVNEELSTILESLYNGGKLKEGINATGRWYTDNGQKRRGKDFAGVHSAEFEYKGNRYVREISNPDEDSIREEFSDGTQIGKKGEVKWLKVEPVSWIIRNWDEMPISINPNGNGKAKWFDLISEEVLTGNIPFYPNEDDKNSTMWQNSMPRGFLNGIDVRDIQENGSIEHGASRGGDFTGECNFLNETFNLGREPIYEYSIPESEEEIVDDAFNGCVTLTKLHIHPGIQKVGKRSFEGINFRYIYRLKSTGELIFDVELPQNREDITEIIELEKLTRTFSGFDYSLVFKRDKLEQISKLAEILNKNKFSIPAIYGEMLIENGTDEEFVHNSDFRFFKSEFKDINDELLNFPEEERLDFFKFAKALGCFSREKMLDKSGKETQTLLGQKATSILVQLLKTEEMKLGKYHELFDSMPFETQVSQEFIRFISLKGKGKFENLDLLLSLERDYPGMLIKVMSNFEDAKSFRDCLDENGKPIKISWEEALKKYYLANKYVGITKENIDIAQLFSGKGLSQDIFNEAASLRKEAKLKKVPEHLLGESLKEETILESIERMKRETQAQLMSGKEIIKELYDKQFTYEWLSKNDPSNSIMGLFCSCCGTITSASYGKDIAKSSVLAEDVQNLVVRNSKGEIISKGTFYLNKERGYGVINDFELNTTYRKHEQSAGRYNVEPDDKEEQEREMIFKAFQRGVKAFVEKYDERNPDKPIKQINIGIGYNRLKKQVERFRKVSNNLTVPSEYNFQDARQAQHILYERSEQLKIEKGGNER